MLILLAVQKKGKYTLQQESSRKTGGIPSLKVKKSNAEFTRTQIRFIKDAKTIVYNHLRRG